MIDSIRQVHQSLVQRARFEWNTCSACRQYEQHCIAALHLYATKKEYRSGKWIRHHENFQVLMASAKSGCHICRCLGYALTLACYSPAALFTLHSSNDPIFVSTLSTTVLRSAHGSLEPRVGHTFTVKGVIEAEMRLGRVSTADFPSVMNRGLHRSTLSTKPREWLSQCHSLHRGCKEFSGSGVMPKRLVDIKRDHPRLLDTAFLGDELYIALSYCWGGDQKMKFTSETELSLRRSIDLTLLSQTIQDAIKFCKDIEMNYLWVDALCIKQDDDGEDWAIEVRNIQEIYGNAYVTLSIASATNAEDGFRNERWPQALDINPYRARLAGMLPTPAPESLSRLRTECPLASRGWVFQEELLSPRILYWSDQGLFWSCMTVTHAESIQAELEEADQKSFDPHEFRKASDPLFLWDDMITAFSTRDFSVVTDRLPAMEGLASIIKASTGEEYVSGLWKSRLPAQLLWIVIDPPSSRLSHVGDMRTKVPDIPSWSWASIMPGRKIEMPKQSSYKTKLTGTAEVGGSLRLRLHGRARPLVQDIQMLQEWPKQIVADDGRPRFPECSEVGGVWAVNRKERKILVCLNYKKPIIIRLDNGLPGVFDNLLCLEITFRGFLLLKPIGDTGVFRRIGCAQSHQDPSFFATSDPQEIEIA